jgi:hypothetical protein
MIKLLSVDTKLSTVMLLGAGIVANVCVCDGLRIGGLKNGTQWNVKPDQSKLSTDTKLRNETKTS